MAVDLGLKPSLASYPFRVQPEDLPCVHPLHEAEDGDDALLAMISSQVEVASLKFKRGDHRQAMNILKRAYRIVENYTESFPIADPVPPAAMLAASTVRLAHCVVLSSMGRHKQALDEAKMAAVEMDKVWRLLFLSSAEQEAATADGDMWRPSAPLRDALRNPPQWLEKAVEVSVQARHCIAIEIEYEAEPRQLKVRPPLLGDDSGFLETTSLGLSTEATAAVPDQDGSQEATTLEAGEEEAQDTTQGEEEEIPDPVPMSEAFSVQEQIGKLHREGVQLARQLLPASHHVRHRAELALDEWLQRTGGDGQPNLPPSDSGPARKMSRRKVRGHNVSGSLARLQSSSSSQALRPSSSPLASSLSAPRLGETEMPSILRMKANSRLPPPSRPWTTASCQSVTATTASTGSAGMFPRGDSGFDGCSGSMSVGTFMSQLSYASASGGDVYMASLPKRGKVPQLEKKKAVRPPSPQATRHSISQETQQESNMLRRGSKERKASMICQEMPALALQAALDGPRKLEIKTPQQRAKEAAILLEQKDPFEDWRRNMVNEKHLSWFQQKLKSDEGQQSLQGELKSEARLFTTLDMKEMDSESLFENRTKYCPSGIKIKQHADKHMEMFKSRNWSMTEEAQAKHSTKQELFQYFNTSCPAEQPSLSSLSNLLQKSQTYGANLDRLAKQEAQRQLEERRRLRAEKLCRDKGLKTRYRKCIKHVGESPTSHFHKSLTAVFKK